jgi:hypothetical protein
MRPLFFALFAGLFTPFFSFSQTQLPDSVSIFGLLQQYEPLSVSIETDIKQLKSDKDDEVWQPAVFKVLKGDSVALRLDVQVAARGNMRKRICDFPPVKIRFYATPPENDSLADINELKLVTSCQDLPENEEWVKREYLLYELFNLVTEQSFRVKRAAVRFEDPEKHNRSMESFSFFMESVKELSARLDGKSMKPKIVSTRSLDSTSYDRMSLFEYMIGNTDWSVRARHNIKIIFLDSSNTIITVPYDFDYAGAVGTNYAAPNEVYPIQTVKERYYLGACRSATHYNKLFDFYLSKEKTLLEHCDKCTCLSQSSKNQMKRYLQQFFDVLRNPKSAKQEILSNCGKGN